MDYWYNRLKHRQAKVHITEAMFDRVLRELHSVGYHALDRDEQAICDAFDKGLDFYYMEG